MANHKKDSIADSEHREIQRWNRVYLLELGVGIQREDPSYRGALREEGDG